MRQLIKNILRESIKPQNIVQEGYDHVTLDQIKARKKLTDYNYHGALYKDGITYLDVKDPKFFDSWFIWKKIIAFDNEDGTEVANASFGKEFEKDKLKSTIDVRPDKRRQGIASTIYEWIEDLVGDTLHPDLPHSPDAEKFWGNKNRKFGLNEAVITNDIASVIKAYNDHAGTDYYPTQNLGGGLNGEAWRIKSSAGGDYVFKLTNAPDEAWTSATLIGKETNYFAKIFDVVQYQDSYIIIQEFLTTAPIRKYIDEIDKIRNGIIYKNFKDIRFEDIKNLANPKVVQNIWNIIQEGQQLGFKALDINTGNIGYKPSSTEWALFDIMDHNQRKISLDKI